jgi:hypothetical protein
MNEAFSCDNEMSSVIWGWRKEEETLEACYN